MNMMSEAASRCATRSILAVSAVRQAVRRCSRKKLVLSYKPIRGEYVGVSGVLRQFVGSTSRPQPLCPDSESYDE